MASHAPALPAASSRVVACSVLHTMPLVVLAPQAFLTPQYLAIAMEYASGGDMFEHVVRKGGLKENEARWFFQQLIVGVDYVHKMVRPLNARRAVRRWLCPIPPSPILDTVRHVAEWLPHALQGVANRDIKLENTLLDGSPRPLVKICDFGYSKVRMGILADL